MLKTALVSAALLAALHSAGAKANEEISVIVTGAAGEVECGLVQMFAREIGTRLPEAYTFECVPRPDAAPEAILDMVQSGRAELAVFSKRPSALEGKFSFYDVPYVFQDLEHARRAIEIGLTSEATKRANKAGLTLLGLYERGFTHFVSINEDIHSLEDLRGLKVGHAGGELADRIYVNLGAEPLRVDSARAGLEQLRTGELDLIELDALEIARLGDAARTVQVHRADYAFRPALFAAARDFWLALPPEHKSAFLEASYAIRSGAASLQERLEAEAWAPVIVESEVGFPEGASTTMKQGQTLYAEKYRTRWLDIASLSR